MWDKEERTLDVNVWAWTKPNHKMMTGLHVFDSASDFNEAVQILQSLYCISINLLFFIQVYQSHETKVIHNQPKH